MFATRAYSFRKMFEHLDRFDRPVFIVETGCAEDLNNWGGSGCSTLIFDKYVQTHPGSEFRSVDINREAVDRCSAVVSHGSSIHCEDSVHFLRMLPAWADHDTLDLLYLDASHLEWREPLLPQKHHLDELLAVLPLLRPDTLVAVDDSPTLIQDWPYIEIGGKGGLVAKYAAQVGAKQVFSAYQVGWTDMVRSETDMIDNDKSTINLKDLLRLASESFHANRIMDANNQFRAILELTPALRSKAERIVRAEACMFFAKMSMVAKRLGTALDWYQQAVNLDPQEVGYRLEMVSQVLRPMRHWDRAISEAMVATRVEPGNIHAWRMLGGIYLWSENLKDAKKAFERAMEIDHDSPEPKLDMISAMFDEEPGEEVYAKIAKLAVEVERTGLRGDAVQARAFIAYREGRHEEAVRLFDEALALGVSEVPTCHWNRGLALHCLGRYREGWNEHTWRAKERTQLPIYIPVNRFTLPMWRGEPPHASGKAVEFSEALVGIDQPTGTTDAPRTAACAPGTTPVRLHVHAEAGFGDNLCCSRYLQLLVDRGYDVRFECYANMIDLMQRSFPMIRMMPQAPDYPGAVGIPPFDYHIPLGELPHVFGTEVDTVPWFGPYLHADTNLVAHYRDKLPPSGAVTKIGLCWSAGIREGLWIAKYGQRKSMHFDDLWPILRNRDVCFFSLQVGPERGQIVPTNTALCVDVLPEEPTWDDTAGLVANLDLVITVDTAVAHLAGAMGKPVWLMNSAEPGSWHWMAERPGSPWNERSPWYPSVKIYRQKKVGQWDEVVGRVARDLRECD